MAKDTNKKAKTASKSSKKPNPIARLFQYFHDVRVELKRVTWPTRKEVLNYCVVVVVTLVFFALFTTLIDMGSTEVITFMGGGKVEAAAPVEDIPVDSTEATPNADGADTGETPGDALEGVDF